MRYFSRFLRSGSPNCWHCETPLYAAGGRRFVLRTLVWGTRRVKGKAHCAISVVSTLAQKTRKNGAPPAFAAGGVDRHRGPSTPLCHWLCHMTKFRSG